MTMVPEKAGIASQPAADSVAGGMTQTIMHAQSAMIDLARHWIIVA